MKDTTTTTQLRHQFVRGLKPTAVNAEKLSLQKHVGCQTQSHRLNEAHIEQEFLYSKLVHQLVRGL